MRLKFFLITMLLSFVKFLCCGGITAGLEFSRDQGKTWDSEFPQLSVQEDLLVKLNWKVEENRLVDMNVATSYLFCRERDFASATKGEQNWGDFRAWYQPSTPGYCGLNSPRPFIFRLNLSSRPEGIMGVRNRWERDKGYVDALLPKCPAFSPGSYHFSVSIGYTLMENRKRVSVVKDFDLIIGGKDAIVSVVVPTTAVPAPKKNPLLVSETLPEIKGDYVFAVEKLTDALNGKPSNVKGALVRADGRDLAWRVDGIIADSYYLRLLVESGTGNGEEQLALPKPFLYFHGLPIHFDRAKGLQLYNGKFYTVIQSRDRIKLAPGDLLRWNRQRQGYFGSLALDRTPLQELPLWINPFVDPLDDDVYRVDGHFDGMLKIKITNVCGESRRVRIETRILDYFQTEVYHADKTVSVHNGGMVEENAVPELGNSDQYRAIVVLSDDRGYRFEKVYTCLTDQTIGMRRTLWLNRGWSWTSLADDGTVGSRIQKSAGEIPTTLSWKPTDLPASWQDYNKNDHLAWYRKTFNLPDFFLSRPCILKIGRIACEADIFLNGEKVGSHSYSEYFGDVSIDLSGKLRPGSNTLLLAMRDRIAVLDPSELNKKVIDLSTAARLRAPFGICPGIDEVYLLSLPPAAIGDITVKPSWRQKTLALEIASTFIPGAVLSNKVMLSGREVFRFPDYKVGKGDSEIKLTGKWDNPSAWGPDKFPLLQLVTELRDEKGVLVDRKDTRFGFREIWADGMDLKWNGKTVKFGSRAFLSSWGWSLGKRNQRDANRNTIREAKLLGCKMLRHIYNPASYADVADEEGMLLAEGVTGISHATLQQLESDEFWNNVYSNAAAAVKSMRNHPSISTWYLSNEYFGESENRNYKRLKALGEKILALDSTRLVEFGCDIDLRGFSNLISVHYPVDMAAFRTTSAYLPEAAYWRRFDQSFHPGMKVPGGMIKKCANVYADSPITWGYKPIIINECCWITFFNPPDGLTHLASDWLYAGPWALAHAHTLANRWFAHGHRDAGVSAITPWTWIQSDPNRNSLPEVDIDVLEHYRHFYAGSTVKFNVNLIHERFKTADLHFSAVLKQGTRVLQTITRDYRFDYCQLKRTTLDLLMPNTNQNIELSLELKLTEKGNILYSDDIKFKVYPLELKKMMTTEQTGLLSDDKELRRLLAGAVNIKGPDSLTRFDRIIVGGDVSEAVLASFQDAFLRFAANGGQVIFASREKLPGWLPGNLRLTGRLGSIAYTFRPNDPLLKGISEEDLSFWYPDHRISAPCLNKPVAGNYRSIIEVGGPNGLIYSALTSIGHGRGNFVICQLNLRPEENPVAAMLWHNLLQIPRNNRTLSAAEYLGRNDSPLRKVLARSGAVVRDFSTDMGNDPNRLVIVDVTSPVSNADLQRLKSTLASGGTVLLHDLEPANSALVENLAGTPIRLESLRAEAWIGRALRLGYADLTAGLTNFDLYWKKHPETESYPGMFYSSGDVLASLGKWTITGNDVRPLLYPSLLATVKCGSGLLVIDNLNWCCDTPDVKDHARRIASTLLTNLGVELRIESTKKMPENLIYVPLDLRGILNRPFTDETDNDGKGGWTDQGASIDLRNFNITAGIHTFKDIPFRIEQPLGCMPLASKYRSGNTKETTISFGKRAEALFFLHACAWTSPKHHASFIVNYADGSNYEIKMIGGINLRDWVCAEPDVSFEHEIDTSTKLAVTVRQDKFGKASLFQTAWVNPVPDKIISSVTVKSYNVGLPILIAVTAGMKQDGTEIKASSPIQRKQAAILVAQAAEMLKKKDNPTAEKLLRRAIEAAPDSGEAWLSLGYIFEERSEFPAAIDAYRTALKVRPEVLEPFMRIGRCYEAMNDFSKAAETYRVSLQVDVNQPNVMSALNAVKAKLK